MLVTVIQFITRETGQVDGTFLLEKLIHFIYQSFRHYFVEDPLYGLNTNYWANKIKSSH